jgi:hypothetical protein
MDDYLDTTDEGYPPFASENAFDNVIETFWSEHDWGVEYYERTETRLRFEDAVFEAIAADVWKRAEDDVREAQSDHNARRDMWRYNGVRQRDFYGT